MKNLEVDNIKVSIYPEPIAMGIAAADFVEGKLNMAIAEKGYAHLILATGASQFQFLDALKQREIDWKKITVFHLDEYKGLAESHPASFRKYLKERILDEVDPKKIYLINGDSQNLDTVIEEYTKALKAHPIDIACIGIGENGHIAFNDPPVADFNDPKTIKIVTLDDDCRKQQLGEGWFPTFEDVPKQALTLTIPTILRCATISCVVPDERKSDAIKRTLYGPIQTECPASILRTHSEIQLFLDAASASKI